MAIRPAGIPAAPQLVQAAKIAPPAFVDAAKPPQVQDNFNARVQTVIRADVGHPQAVNQPHHWDYVDYDQYHRPSFYNPLPQDASLRYYYNGDYRTVMIPAGGRVVLDVIAAAVFPFTMLAGDLISTGSFIGGGWIPPYGWNGPPPADWQAWQPQSYSDVPVDFANADQSALVDQVTVVGHDGSLPAGQQDVVLLNDSTVARGQVQPAPNGGPPHVTVQQTQTLPGVGPWDDGHGYVNTAVPKPIPPSNSHLPWVIGGLATLFALLTAGAAWIWKHPRGTLAAANAPIDVHGSDSLTEWLSPDGDNADTRFARDGTRTESWRRRLWGGRS